MGIVLLREEKDKTKIGIWKVEESMDDLKSKLLLNDRELEFYNSLNKGKRNVHWLSSRVMLRQLMNTDRFIQVEGDDHGKPHIKNFDYELSITHSYDYAAAIISKQKVGIDIERVKPLIVKIVSKFLSKREIEEVGDLESNIEKLYVYWCTKESLFKLNGKKHLHFRQNIKVDPFDFNPPGKVTARIVEYKTNGTFQVHYEKINGYMFTYVIDNF